MPEPQIVALGTKNKWGIVESVLWIGERYYMMLNKRTGVVSLMPACVVEESNA